MIDYTKIASRMPPPVERRSVVAEALEAYDQTVAHGIRFNETNGSKRPPLDGRPYQFDYYRAWTNAPSLFLALMAVGRAGQAEKGRPGSVGLTEHELIDIVLSLDSGYNSFLPGHTATAISAGVRIEALEALGEGRTSGLTDDERQQVEFIRAVRDLMMTDDIWCAMVERLGSIRGAVAFAYLVCYLDFHQHMMWAFGAPGMDLEDWKRLVQEFKDGSRDPVPMTHAYVWEYQGLPTPEVEG